MKKVLAILTAVMMLAAPFAWADEAAPAEARGEHDAPALTEPEARYEIYFDETDGSEQALFMLLDELNDEERTIEEHGALYATENLAIDGEGVPMMSVNVTLQGSPYGTVLIMAVEMLGMQYRQYRIADKSFLYDGETVSVTEGTGRDDYDFYCKSYHFPYGRLEVMNGVRQDENGYTYLLVKSDENRSFEFVTDNERIVQLRVYERDGSGKLALVSFVDYSAGPAVEIPQAVAEEMEKAFGEKSA